MLSELSEMQANLKTPSQRLLVIKHGALGDIVQGFGAFASLRAGHPDAHIALLTTAPFVELAHMMPWFDEVLIDRRAGVLHLQESWRMRKLIRNNWDMIVDLQCSQRTARYFQFFARPDTRWIGTAAGCSDPCPDFTGVNNHQRMRIAAEMAGGAEAVHDMGWLFDQAAPRPVPGATKPYAVLVPGCSHAKPQKRWPAENFAALARTCHEDNISVMLTGTTADRDVIEMVQSLAPDAINLCGQTSIADLARLTASAEFVVGNDTGPVFLAAATGAPTIMVMGPDTNPEMSAPTGPRCDWVRATPISNVSIDDVGGALQRLTSKPV
jgi:ADP-heptose:LPS heptosyltransferase